MVNLRSNISTYAGGDIRDNVEYFNGKIDEILIFDTALSQTEVEQIYVALQLKYMVLLHIGI